VKTASQNPLHRRDFLKLVGLTTAGLGLSACAPSILRETARDRGNVSLVYQDCGCTTTAQQMLEKFNTVNPNIKVFFTSDPEKTDEQVLTDFEAGSAPDVFASCCDLLPILAQNGYLLDLRPFVQADLDRSAIDDWDAAQYQAFFTGKGVQFALPKYHGALAIYYNKDVFDKYNVDYPDGTWNHDDYHAAMKRLTKFEGQDSKDNLWGSMLDVSWERIQIHVNGWGGHLVDPNDPTRSLMAEPEAMAALEWIRSQMWDDHIMANSLDVQKLEPKFAFNQGRLAMVEEGSWALKDILDGAPFRLGVTTFPAGPKHKVTLSTTDGYAVYAGTKHPEAAWELMKYLTGRDYERALAESILLQPASASLVDEWIGYIQKGYPEKVRSMDLTAFAEGQMKGYSVTAEIFANMAEARRIVLPAWKQIFTLGQASVDTIREISAQVDQAQHIQ